MKRPHWKWKRFGWHNLVLGLLCLAVLAVAISSLGGSSASSAAARQTATVGRGVVQSTVSGSGSLEPARQVELDFGASGEVTAIEVEAGQRVSKGQVLARVNASSAEASLAQAEAQLIEAEETLTSASEASEEEVARESDPSTSTTLLIASVSEAEGAPEEGAQGDAPSAGAEGEEEVEEGGDGESGTGNGKSNEAPTSSEEPSEEPSEEFSEPSSGESSAAAGSGVSVATAEAQLLEAELNVKSAEQEVSETILRAPIAGTVASVSGSVGETVSGGSSGSVSAEASAGGVEQSAAGTSSAFVVLSQLGRMKLQVSFSEADINEVEVGQTATVTVSSLEEVELAGEVTHVDLLPSESSSSSVVEYSATILLTQTEKGLRSGMSATAEVVVEEVENAIAVPSEAISGAGQGKSVTVEGEDGSEVRRSVTTGLTGDETTQVISGVEPGETLILPEVTIATGGESGDNGDGGFGDFSGGPPSGDFSGGPPAGFPGGGG